jgi:predicted amidohydrolase YtcJ
MFGLRENGWFLKLHGIDSKEELLGKIAERARRTPKGEWVSCWGVESLDINYLRRTDLDRVSTDHPILVVHSSGQWGIGQQPGL